MPKLIPMDLDDILLAFSTVDATSLDVYLYMINFIVDYLIFTGETGELMLLLELFCPSPLIKSSLIFEVSFSMMLCLVSFTT